MRDLIDESRRNFGPAPRIFSRGILTQLRAGRPWWLWLRPFDELHDIFPRQERILTQGRIFWGQIVQANSLLFRPGPTDSPAQVIYSFDPSLDAKPERLERWATGLYDLKGTAQSDPRLAAISRTLANEMTRTPRSQVPRELTDGQAVFSSTLMVFRKHLPGRFLAHGLFPLIVHSEMPHVMILPWQFWPQRLLALWRS